MEEQGGGFLSKPRNLIIVAIVGVLAIGVFLARRGGSASTSGTSGGTQYIPTTGDTYVNYSYTSTVPPSAPGSPAVPPASTGNWKTGNTVITLKGPTSLNTLGNYEGGQVDWLKSWNGQLSGLPGYSNPATPLPAGTTLNLPYSVPVVG